MTPTIFQRQSYNFPVRADLVAQTPLAQRDRSRLLLRSAGGNIQHRSFHELPEILPEGSTLVLNDSHVIAARLLGHNETGGAIELLLMERLADQGRPTCESWRCIGKPQKKFRLGSKLKFAEGLVGEVSSQPEKLPNQVGTFEVCFNREAAEFRDWLERCAYVPLPTYIERKSPQTAQASSDFERYQTVYAAASGSVAAPTAGLHFTRELLERLKQKGVHCVYVTLHVGGGTFLPIKCDDIRQHHMHEERFTIPRAALAQLLATKAAGKPIICVGTTALRALETLKTIADQQGKDPLEFCGRELRSQIFIMPQSEQDRYQPWLVDGLLTNFHQPESSLFVLVSALCGLEPMKRLYQEAQEQNYRLFSYGDASLLWL